MKKLLKELNKTYDLKLGNKLFSPVMQCSIGLAMQYRELVKGGLKSPFHFNFPDKRNAALWFSVALLRNYLLEDYVYKSEDRVDELGISKGEKIDVFNTVAIFKGVENGKLRLKFKDQSTIGIPKKWERYVNTTTKKRVNKVHLFTKNRSKAKKERNAISKLLEPDEPKLINPKILKSKVLVIAGRGNTGSFSNHLKKEKIFGESLSDIFNSGENLIIKPDLEDYKFLTAPDNKNSAQRFEHYFLRFKGKLKEAIPEREEDVKKLISKVIQSDYRNHDFLQLFSDIIDEVDNEKLNKLYELHPGIKESLPNDLKAVVINDISQVEYYEGLIKEFLNRKIPVIITSNRLIDERKALHFFNNYFQSHSDELRINWNKQKIKALKRLNKPSENYLDQMLWKKCLKFSKQTIKISAGKPHPVDPLLIQIQRIIGNVEGQERLRDAYWKFFNPLVYSFKNGNGWYPYHNMLLNNFLEIFDELKSTLNINTKELFEAIIDNLQETKNNYKEYGIGETMFIQSVEVEHKENIFPETDGEYLKPTQLNDDVQKITFSGFPLNEPLNKDLINCACEHLTEDITIKCWPEEGTLTYNYLYRRLKAGYFFDNIPSGWKIDNKLLINSEEDIKKEIDSALITNYLQKSIEHEKDEKALEDISLFKYDAHRKDNHSGQNEYSKNCNIIDLENGAFMFLPKNGSVLAKIEVEGEEFNFKKAKFKDLNRGDEIFRYDLSKAKLRELTRNIDGSGDIFNNLDIWKKSILSTFSKNNFDTKKLLDVLKYINEKHDIGASPTYPNVRNWLFDEHMLSPEKQNLKMILLADSEPNKIDLLSKCTNAYKKARSLSQKVNLLHFGRQLVKTYISN